MKKLGANRLFLSILFCLAAISTVAGCAAGGKPQDKIFQYVLEYPQPKKEASGPFAEALKVKRFSAAPAYNTTRMIFRESPFRREEYVFHKWRVNPADMVTDFLARDLRASGLFSAVFSGDASPDADLVLSGSVDEFLESDDDKVWRAVLAITVTLLDESEADISRRVIMQRGYGAEAVLAEKDPRELASAMSKAMAQVSASVISEIRAILKKRAEGGAARR
jgi:ABC-type uncharacterized transport system auxiliary subunit